MKKTQVRVTLDIEIWDEDAFRAAALARAKADGLDKVGPDTGFDPDDLAQCAQMLFDPGLGPDGCSIEQSSAEDL